MRWRRVQPSRTAKHFAFVSAILDFCDWGVEAECL